MPELTDADIHTVLAALDDYEQEMSNQGNRAELANATKLYHVFDKERCRKGA